MEKTDVQGHSVGLLIMDSFCLVSTVQAVSGVMVWWVFSWHTLGPLVPIDIVADHAHPFITTLHRVPFILHWPVSAPYLELWWNCNQFRSRK
uniref:Uncharacterized protein n=1 Tax=Sander lucioperca TaxID=283035 RepID=A0A8C9X2Y8_SANLU